MRGSRKLLTDALYVVIRVKDSDGRVNVVKIDDKLPQCRAGVRKLAGEEFEIAFEKREVGSRLIGLAQRQGVFVCHATRYDSTRLRKRNHSMARQIETENLTGRPIDQTISGRSIP
jgi:hypothetical protein